MISAVRHPARIGPAGAGLVTVVVLLAGCAGHGGSASTGTLPPPILTSPSSGPSTVPTPPTSAVPPALATFDALGNAICRRTTKAVDAIRPTVPPRHLDQAEGTRFADYLTRSLALLRQEAIDLRAVPHPAAYDPVIARGVTLLLSYVPPAQQAITELRTGHGDQALLSLSVLDRSVADEALDGLGLASCDSDGH